MKQTSSITRAMTAAQEGSNKREVDLAYAANQAIVYRLYTEEYPNLRELIARYFKGFTLIPTEGVYNGVSENGAVIEIIGSAADLQSVVHLAGDIRQVNAQTSVLVTWNNASLLNVTANV